VTNAETQAIKDPATFAKRGIPHFRSSRLKTGITIQVAS